MISSRLVLLREPFRKPVFILFIIIYLFIKKFEWENFRKFVLK
jgi:hypothetical protein